MRETESGYCTPVRYIEGVPFNFVCLRHQQISPGSNKYRMPLRRIFARIFAFSEISVTRVTARVLFLYAVERAILSITQEFTIKA